MARGRFDDPILERASFRRALRLQEDAATLGGNVTLVDNDMILAAYDAGGSSRNVTLPTRSAENDGVLRIVSNISTAGENLVIKTHSATTLLTLPSGGVALVFGSRLTEAPGTREWIAVPVGGEDLAIADDLAVTGDLTVTGASALNGNVALGNSAADVIGAYGFTSSQPTSANQAAVSSATISQVSLSATQTSAWGVTNSSSLATLQVSVNDNSTRVIALVTLVNQLRSDLVATGWIKGS